jgi:hypothetical protein
MLSTLLDSFTRKLDSIPHVYKKKVCVLGMVALINQGRDPVVLGKLRGIMACVRRVEKELGQQGAQLFVESSGQGTAQCKDHVTDGSLTILCSVLLLSEQPDFSVALRTPPQERIEAHRIQLVRFLVGSVCESAMGFYSSHPCSLIHLRRADVKRGPLRQTVRALPVLGADGSGASHARPAADGRTDGHVRPTRVATAEVNIFESNSCDEM